jgi:hypothetical protein
MIDSLIKQQTAWSQGSSKYQKQKKCTHSEISINEFLYVYNTKKKQLFFKFKFKGRVILERTKSGSDPGSFITL